MPLYEGIALIQEKQAVVLDIGTAYTKFGFTGEPTPRCIIPSQYECPKEKVIKKIADYQTEDDLFNMLVEHLHNLYFRHVLVNPKDRKVVVVESLLSCTLFRETLARVLFSHYEVSSVLFASSALLSSVTLGTTAALVIDIGYNEAIATAVAHGLPMPPTTTAQPTAARAVHDELRKYLDEENKRELNLTEKLIEDIKIKTCFVTKLDRANAYLTETPPSPPPAVQYPLPPGQGGDSQSGIITVSGRARELSAEALFPRDYDNCGLGNVILDCLLKCPIDLRKPLAENILLTGGTAMLPGIKSRISQELRYLMNHPPYKDRLYITDFKLHTAPAKENYIAWVGGSIFGATDAINTRSLTREAYNKDQRVKDWVNLLDNTSSDNPHWSAISL